MSSTRAPAFGAWLDAFFAAYFSARPVNATFIGMHAYDDRLPDFSAAGQASMAAEAGRLLASLDTLEREPLGVGEGLDWELARGFLEIAQWEAGSCHFGWGNPSLFTGEAIFGVLSLLLRPFAPLTERLDLAAARLAAIPDFLDTGRATLHDAPLAWCLRARRECAGARILLDGGLARLLHDAGIEHPSLLRNAAQASTAFARFDAFIASDLLPNATESYACGAEPFDRLLRRAHFLDLTADELERLALDRMAQEAAALAAAAPARDTSGVAGARPRSSSVGPPRTATETTPQPVAPPAVGSVAIPQRTGSGTDERAVGQANIASPPVGAAAVGGEAGYLARFAELWDSTVEAAERLGLLTFPDWPVRYVEQPPWMREAAPYLYFLPYRAPAAFDVAPVVDYFVPPSADDSTIKLNHVIHHGSLGHHVQNWHATRAPSRIGQVAAIDCASRIAMLCGGTLGEGWACYATDLADEAGLLTPAESVAQHTARLRMAARAVVDIRLHHRRQTLDEAADFYQQAVGMSAQGAHAEAVKNSLFPGAACMYLAGWDAIWTLRRELQSQHGFTLREFHDRLLSYGSVPVTLVGRAMRAADAALATR